MPLLEEATPEEKAAKANALLRTRVRDVEDTLAQLVHDEDEVLSAAAIQRVEEKGLWRLADDLEHVLEHRAARDWLVFETASWALAVHRMPAEERRSSWREPLPAVVAAERMGRVPLLRFASVGQLLRLARPGRTERPDRLRILQLEGSAPTQLQLLLEGTVAVQRAGASREQPAPLALGLEAVLGGERQRETVSAGEGAVVLTVEAADLLGILSEDIALTRPLFRALLEDSGADSRVLRARRPVAAAERAGARTLETVHVLEASPLFSRATPEQLVQLAQAAREVPLAPPNLLLDDADPPAVYVIASGQVSLEQDGGAALLAGPGDTLGVRETLAGVGGTRARAEAAGLAVRIDAEALFELLAADTDLLRGTFGVLLERSGR